MIRTRELVGLVALAATTVGCSVGQSPHASSSAAADTPSASHEPPTSLQQIADAASGRPGQPLPACPSVEQVDALKEAGITFGPCDPLPEPGETPAVPESPAVSEPNRETKRPSCPMVTGDKADETLNTALNCAVGARILEWDHAERAAQSCMVITYIPERNAGQITETLCPDQAPSSGGVPMGQLWDYVLDQGVWVIAR